MITIINVIAFTDKYLFFFCRFAGTYNESNILSQEHFRANKRQVYKEVENNVSERLVHEDASGRFAAKFPFLLETTRLVQQKTFSFLKEDNKAELNWKIKFVE